MKSTKSAANNNYRPRLVKPILCQKQKCRTRCLLLLQLKTVSPAFEKESNVRFLLKLNQSRRAYAVRLINLFFCFVPRTAGRASHASLSQALQFSEVSSPLYLYFREFFYSFLYFIFLHFVITIILIRVA